MSTLRSEILAAGPGWWARNIHCNAGPGDRIYEEQHQQVCVAVVCEGTFTYRSGAGTALLSAGAVVLGNHTECFACGHEHARGDRCIGFHYEPALFEDLIAGTPGVRRMEFVRPSLPPLRKLQALIAAAEIASRSRDASALEEVAFAIGAAAAAAVSETAPKARSPSRVDERRVAEILALLGSEADQTHSLAALAARVGVSPYHFLRVFKQTTGATPHQYILRLRMRRAAQALCHTAQPVGEIAFALGFGDLSTFNRQFKALMGATPTAYRRRANT